MDFTPLFFGLYKLSKYGLYPLTWVLLVLSAAMLMARGPASRSRLRRVRGLIGVALALLLLLSSPLLITPLVSTLEAWTPAPHLTPLDRFDAIVVLGGGVLPQGSLRPTPELSSGSLTRTTCGVTLYQQGYAPRIVFTGGNARVIGTGPLEAVAMHRWAIRLGVPEAATLMETASRTTAENASNTRRLLQDNAILLVSDASHLPRAVRLFTNQGFQVTPFPCHYQTQNQPLESWSDLDLSSVLPNIDAFGNATQLIVESVGLLLSWLGRL